MFEVIFSEKAKKLTNLARQYAYASKVLHEKIYLQKIEGRLEDTCTEHDAYSYLWVPSLQLSAHALECMLKACAYLNQVTPPEGGKKGHDLNAMIQQPYAQPLYDQLLAKASRVANDMKKLGAYDHLDLENPMAWMDQAVFKLGKLHHERGSMLRYGSDDPNEEAPSSPLLQLTIYEVSQELGRSASAFIVR